MAKGQLQPTATISSLCAGATTGRVFPSRPWLRAVAVFGAAVALLFLRAVAQSLAAALQKFRGTMSVRSGTGRLADGRADAFMETLSRAG